jgi:hypothetical protein
VKTQASALFFLPSDVLIMDGARDSRRRSGVKVRQKEFLPRERHMPEYRHCRHCMGDCPGNCLIGDSGRCIHGWNEKRPRQFTWQLLLTRKWWHRVFRGV